MRAASARLEGRRSRSAAVAWEVPQAKGLMQAVELMQAARLLQTARPMQSAGQPGRAVTALFSQPARIAASASCSCEWWAASAPALWTREARRSLPRPESREEAGGLGAATR